MTEQIYESMRRTNSVHNTLVPNREYEEIIYDPRSAFFFGKSALKFSQAGKIEGFSLIGNTQYLCALTGEEGSTSINVLQYSDSSKDMSLLKILPCCSTEQSYNLNTLKLLPHSDILVRVYEGNLC